LSLKAKESQVFLLENFKITKTKEAFSFLEKAKKNLDLKDKVLLLYGQKEGISKYFRNLAKTKMLNVANLNVYQLIKAGSLLITQDGLAEIIKEK